MPTLWRSVLLITEQESGPVNCGAAARVTAVLRESSSQFDTCAQVLPGALQTYQQEMQQKRETVSSYILLY